MNRFDKYDKELGDRKLLIQKQKSKRSIFKFAGITNSNIGGKNLIVN